MNELALFAGAGGGILGGELHGRRTVCAVERDAYAAQVLVQRQNDGSLRPFPIWSDVETFDGRPWKGIAQLVSAGFPCQDISICGTGAGLGGRRSGLWIEAKRIIREVEPEYVELENSPMLTSRGLGIVLADLAELGFDAEWGMLGANATGLDHCRERIWIVAHSNRNRLQGEPIAGNRFEEVGEIIQRRAFARGNDETRIAAWRHSQPGIFRVVDGMAVAVDRLKAIGNGQVPRVEAAAWRLLA